MIKQKMSVIFRTLMPILMLGVMAFGQPAGALSDGLIKKYDDYQVYFYNAEQRNCIDKDDDDDDDDDDTRKTDEWDGHCSDLRTYWPKMEEYFDEIYSVAQRNGLPWEGIMAQLIGESGFMSKEVCPFNPLGLKGEPSCDGKHRIFSNYAEAFNYYVHSIRPVREAMGRFQNDPYGYIVFLIKGVPGYRYATDPNYINKISGHVCGVQQWAKTHGKPISGSGGSKAGGGDAAGSSDGGGGSGGGTSGSDVLYCSDDDDDKLPTDLIFYSQCDPRWRNFNYGADGIHGDASSGTICSSGCGPTSFAVIAANLKNKNITPAETADLAGRAGMHVEGAGSSWGITSYLAGHYGMSASKISGTVSAINEYLDNGYMIHTSGSGGAPFTTGGHYIAIVKKLSDGKWLVADSSSRGPSGEYDPATVLSGMNEGNVWAVK